MKSGFQLMTMEATSCSGWPARPKSPMTAKRMEAVWVGESCGVMVGEPGVGVRLAETVGVAGRSAGSGLAAWVTAGGGGAVGEAAEGVQADAVPRAKRNINARRTRAAGRGAVDEKVLCCVSMTQDYTMAGKTK